MKFSLIIGTLNRSNELKYCLESISNQLHTDFEVIVIDQSIDDLTEKITKDCGIKNLIYKRVGIRGLSRARNIALSIATGDYFCLIDDDAFYPADYLEKLYGHIIQNNTNTILTGYMWDSINEKSFVDYSKLHDDKPMSIKEIMRYCPSPCVTFPMSIVSSVGTFDENFGVGSTYGAGEESDLILRAVQAGYQIKYYRNIEIKHPHEKLRTNMNDQDGAKKKCAYAEGLGALFCKHIEGNSKLYSLNIYFGQLMLKNIVKVLLGYPNAKQEMRGYFDGYKKYHKLFKHDC